MVNSFSFHYIWQLWLTAYTNYTKFCTRKWKKQHYVYCNYNDILIFNKILDNRAILAHHPSAYKISWVHYKTRKAALVFTRKDSKHYFQNYSTSVNRSLIWKIYNNRMDTAGMDFFSVESKFLNHLLFKWSNQMQPLSNAIMKTNKSFWI